MLYVDPRDLMKNATIHRKTNNDKGSSYTVTVALDHKKLPKEYKRLSLL